VYSCSDSKIVLDLVVEDEHQGTTGTSDDVGEGSLEEGFGTFVLKDFLEAIDGASVHDIGSSRLHHESSSHGIERIRSNTSGDCYGLSEGPHDEEVSLL
jgi:hypothetical protein